MFGIVPPFMAGRAKSLIEDISAAFSNGIGDPNLSTIISGARGTGKTAMLSFMAEEASSQGWIAANATAADGCWKIFSNRRRSPRAISSKRWQEYGLKGISVGQLVGIEWKTKRLVRETGASNERAFGSAQRE